MTNTLLPNGGAAEFAGLLAAPGHGGSCFVDDSGSGPVASSLQLLL